jgi:hypothetical protein
VPLPGNINLVDRTTAQLLIENFHTLLIVDMDQAMLRQVKFRTAVGASATCANVATPFHVPTSRCWFVGAHEICVGN